MIDADEAPFGPGVNSLRLGAGEGDDGQPVLRAFHNGLEIPLFRALDIAATLIELIMEGSEAGEPPMELIDALASLFFVIAVIEAQLMRGDEAPDVAARQGRS